VFTSAAAVSVRENASGVIYRPVATDPEGSPLIYGATIGGADAPRFTMNAVTREVRFAVQPDFEAPADAGANNVYDISFTVSDGVNTTTQNLAVTVSNVANGFHVRRVAFGLNQPVFAADLSDGSGRMVVVQKGGLIRLFMPDIEAFAANNFLDLTGSTATDGEKGLLGIAFSPNFIEDRAFYIHYNPTATLAGVVLRLRTTAAFDTVPAASETIISVSQPAGCCHRGGTIAFDRAGRLVINLGDGGGRSFAQDTSTPLGKLLRIDPATDGFPADPQRNYSIPPANPFAGGGGLPEIWAIGLRNPFRGSFDPVTGDYFFGDVGETLIEEVDRIPSTSTGPLNFGWPRREGSQSYLGGADDPSFLLSVTEYEHGAGPQQGNTVIGGVVYRGPVEDLQGQYIFGDFISGNVWSAPIASLTPGTVLPAASLVNRKAAFTPDVSTINAIAGFATDRENNLYIIDLDGEMFRLDPG
jgi:glucose/arabinose dehydrogenase